MQFHGDVSETSHDIGKSQLVSNYALGKRQHQARLVKSDRVLHGNSCLLFALMHPGFGVIHDGIFNDINSWLDLLARA